MFPDKEFFIMPFVFTLFILLSACAEIKTSTVNTASESKLKLKNPDSHSSLITEPILDEANDKCLPEIVEVEVFQVLADNVALAWACKNSSKVCSDFVVALKPDGETFWINKRIKAPNEKCIIFRDAYEYITNNGTKESVPVIEFDNKYAPVDAEIEFKERIRELLTTLRSKCLTLDTKENTQLCRCYADSIEKISKETENLMNFNPDDDSISKMLLTNIEKNCGKIPESWTWFK